MSWRGAQKPEVTPPLSDPAGSAGGGNGLPATMKHTAPRVGGSPLAIAPHPWGGTTIALNDTDTAGEHPNTKAILAANDSMALGAVAAVKAAGKSGDVLVVGFDNISAVQQAIQEGKILATADQHGDQLAVFGIQNALKLLEDKDAVVEDVETPVDLITQETLAK